MAPDMWEAIVSCFIPVGAVGMAGWALLNLATAAELHVKSYIMKLPESHHTAAWLDAVLPACMAAAVVLGLCLWANSGWWLLLAICSVAQTVRQGIPFSLGWWGAVFPIGTFAGTTVALGQLFHEHPLRVLGAVISCCQVAVWLFVAGMMVYKGLAGDLFHPPCLAPPPADKGLTTAASDVERRLSQVTGGLTGSHLDDAAVAAFRQHLAAYSSGQLNSAVMASGAVPPGIAGSCGSMCLPHQSRAQA